MNNGVKILFSLLKLEICEEGNANVLHLLSAFKIPGTAPLHNKTNLF